MLRKSDGFILSELLLSLSCFLMLCLFFIPLINDLKFQYRNLEVEKEANQLLFEELQSVIVSPLSSQNHTTMINGVEYQINLRETYDSGKKEVCIRVEKNRFNLEKNICYISE